MQSTTHTYIHKHSQRQKRVPINNELSNELLNAICNFSLIVFLLLHAFAMQHPNSGCHFRISTFSHCHRKRRWLYEITNILPQLGRRREKCCLRVDVKEVKKCETWNGKITKKAEKKNKKGNENKSKKARKTVCAKQPWRKDNAPDVGGKESAMLESGFCKNNCYPLVILAEFLLWMSLWCRILGFHFILSSHCNLLSFQHHFSH